MEDCIHFKFKSKESVSKFVKCLKVFKQQQWNPLFLVSFSFWSVKDAWVLIYSLCKSFNSFWTSTRSDHLQVSVRLCSTPWLTIASQKEMLSFLARVWPNSCWIYHHWIPMLQSASQAEPELYPFGLSGCVWHSCHHSLSTCIKTNYTDDQVHTLFCFIVTESTVTWRTVWGR